MEGAEGSKITTREPLAKFCDLVQMDSDTLTHVLTFRELQTMAPGGKVDVYQVPQNNIQAAARRDAIAKALYERLFDMVVKRINVALDTEGQEQQNTEMLSIGVLDIYGFEVFGQNGFEQLCINYVNEKLQQIFIELTLRAEQEEYEREGIAWQPIPFFNNKIVCELFDGSKPTGIFRALDDTCKTMHGTRDGLEVDLKFLETAASLHASNAYFKRISNVFVIKHYAGDVTYTCGKFADANKDSLNKDLLMAIKTAGDKLIGVLFPEEVDLNDKKAPPTAANKIRTQCQALVTALMDCSPHYVRCIKSNDEKKALKIDRDRVKHQVKYLGLAENIKVRRAGFAYRADYHRFLDRFGIMSPDTYPEWRGTDKDGCRQIIKAVAKKMEGLTKEEVQLGKSKVFVRQPETYFALERFLEIRRGDFVVSIQRAWRRYSGQREFVILQNHMAKLYSQEKKLRRADSIFRPYSGDYLDALTTAKAESVRDGFFRIIDHYDESENVVFADASCSQVVAAPSATGWSLEAKLVVLTSAALYLIDIYVPPQVQPGSSTPAKKLPELLLRRRISLKVAEGLEGIHMSRLADNAIALLVRPQSRLPAGSTENWVEDSKVVNCQSTGTPFSLFTRRHHCRVSGRIFIDRVCDYLQTVPDLGYYTPQRVSDDMIGLESTDILEDVLLLCNRRSELAVLLNTHWKKCNRAERVPMAFNNLLQLRSGPEKSISRIPSPDIQFTETPRGARLLPQGVCVDKNAGKLVISSPPGLPHELVQEKSKRRAARQKKAEIARKRRDAERLERSAQKEQEREQERLERLSEKKARKESERAAKRAQEAALSERPAGRQAGAGRRFGDSSSASSEVEASEPASEGDKRSIGRGVGGGGAKKPSASAVSVSAGAGSELAAKMAKRRAALQGEN